VESPHLSPASQYQLFGRIPDIYNFSRLENYCSEDLEFPAFFVKYS